MDTFKKYYCMFALLERMIYGMINQNRKPWRAIKNSNNLMYLWHKSLVKENSNCVSAYGMHLHRTNHRYIYVYYHPATLMLWSNPDSYNTPHTGKNNNSQGMN